MLSTWTQSSNNVYQVSFVVSLKIVKKGKPFTDGEYVKDCFIRVSKELFRDFENKAEIMNKINDLPLSAKTVQDKTAKMSSNVTRMQVEDIQVISARIMSGIDIGTTSILQKKIDHEILTFHCIIHQEALCAQNFQPK